jgi:hypothetical protein
MVMSQQTIDTVVGILTIPLINKILKNAPNGKPRPSDYQEIVESYFDLKLYFEHKYLNDTRC